MRLNPDRAKRRRYKTRNLKRGRDGEGDFSVLSEQDLSPRSWSHQPEGPHFQKKPPEPAATTSPGLEGGACASPHVGDALSPPRVQLQRRWKNHGVCQVVTQGAELGVGAGPQPGRRWVFGGPRQTVPHASCRFTLGCLLVVKADEPQENKPSLPLVSWHHAGLWGEKDRVGGRGFLLGLRVDSLGSSPSPILPPPRPGTPVPRRQPVGTAPTVQQPEAPASAAHRCNSGLPLA